ncbi:MAG: hypothetical protein M3Q03_06390 [Chloroflexota bacterium]|nr:hypothetical protein [Chloroflexota bacterium]
MQKSPIAGVVPTRYKGITFRSRTEARWAYFFDELGVPWDYEPEQYTDGKTAYLPDFYLPDQDCFWEVKGEATYSERKPSMLATLSGKPVYVAVGQPKFDSALQDILPQCETCNGPCPIYRYPYKVIGSGRHAHTGIYPDNLHLWMVCRDCGNRSLGQEWRTVDPCPGCGGDNRWIHAPELHAAYTAVREYNFGTPRAAASASYGRSYSPYNFTYSRANMSRRRNSTRR